MGKEFKFNMTQDKRLRYLIQFLLNETSEYSTLQIPAAGQEQKKLLRSLMNVRLPRPISPEFLEIQDAYLQEELLEKKVTSLLDLSPVKDGIYLWKGDITTLQTDGIVNAGNSGLLGCFVPCHGCIDNAIHSFAGIQLRLACQEMMERQQSGEPVGKAKITEAYNLPSRFVLHTVGPVIHGRLREEDCVMLASCYRSCLELADTYHLKSIAFCCISTGEFHFPNEIAAQIAVNTVTAYRKNTHTEMEVVFNVFGEKDYSIYQQLLRKN